MDSDLVDPEPSETAKRLMERVEALREKAAEKEARSHRTRRPAEEDRLPYKEPE